jgi:hypothetical protein
MRSTRARTLLAALTAAIALLVAAGSAAAATIPIQGGEVDWGVKQSFRSYVKGPIAKGQITIGGGAVEASDGTFRFPVGSGSYDTTTHVTTVQASGSVHFLGHFEGPAGEPLLDLTFTDPRAVVGPTSGAIFADVESRAFNPGSPTPGPLESFPDVELATLAPEGIMPTGNSEEVGLAGIPATLTEAGAKAFAGFYSKGTALDPLGLIAAFHPTPPLVVDQPAVDPLPTTPVTPVTNADPAPATPVPTVLPMPKLKSAAGEASLGKGGSAVVAQVACPSAGACTLDAPKSARFKLGGKSFAAKVIAPHWILAGKTAKVAVKVPRGALAKLAGKQAKISLKVTLGIGEQRSTEVVKATLKGQEG